MKKVAFSLGMEGRFCVGEGGLEAQAGKRFAAPLKLKERRALLGIDAPPELLIQIEDLETEIAELKRG